MCKGCTEVSSSDSIRDTKVIINTFAVSIVSVLNNVIFMCGSPLGKCLQ